MNQNKENDNDISSRPLGLSVAAEAGEIGDGVGMVKLREFKSGCWICIYYLGLYLMDPFLAPPPSPLHFPVICLIQSHTAFGMEWNGMK